MTRERRAAVRATAWVGAVTVALLAACADSGAQGPAKGGPPPAAPVEVAAVVQKDVPVQLRTVGTVAALATVEVRPQVSGVLQAVHFEEGQDVAAGAPLFTIDPAPFDVAVEEARAALARQHAQAAEARAALVRDQAQLAQAKVQRERYGKLHDRGFSAQEQVDELSASAESLAAGVSAARAAIRTAEAGIRAEEARLHRAELTRGYADIRSPIAGRVGELLVDVGNLVGSNDPAPLVVLHQIEPLEVTFAVPQEHLAAIRARQAGGETLAVAVTIGGDPRGAVHGVVTFVDASVHPATGTLRLKARFDNAHRRLWPGQLVSVDVTLASLPAATVAPAAAVLIGQKGPYAYVVRADQTVEDRALELGPRSGEEYVITKGLAPGETVVVDGQLRLARGVTVAVRQPAGQPAPAAAPPSAPGAGPAPTPTTAGTRP